MRAFLELVQFHSCDVRVEVRLRFKLGLLGGCEEIALVDIDGDGTVRDAFRGRLEFGICGSVSISLDLDIRWTYGLPESCRVRTWRLRRVHSSPPARRWLGSGIRGLCRW